MYKSIEGCTTGIESVQEYAPNAEIYDLTGDESGTGSRFEVYRDKNNDEYYFRLFAGNGEKIVKSEGYTLKPSCIKGIKSVRENASNAEIDDTTEFKLV